MIPVVSQSKRFQGCRRNIHCKHLLGLCVRKAWKSSWSRSLLCRFYQRLSSYRLSWFLLRLFVAIPDDWFNILSFYLAESVNVLLLLLLLLLLLFFCFVALNMFFPDISPESLCLINNSRHVVLWSQRNVSSLVSKEFLSVFAVSFVLVEIKNYRHFSNLLKRWA